MRAHTNNRAETVLRLFREAVERFGAPSRMRGDRGGENLLVAIWMICFRGLNRGSFMWGSSVLLCGWFPSSTKYFSSSSTRNTRIERLWLEVGKRFGRLWRAFFARLERLHGLDVDSPQHLWLLHALFLDELNGDVELFQEEWARKPISGPSAKHMSPKVCRCISPTRLMDHAQDMRLLGQTQHGIYDPDDCQDVDPSLIHRYYGVDDENEQQGL